MIANDAVQDHIAVGAAPVVLTVIIMLQAE